MNPEANALFDRVNQVLATVIDPEYGLPVTELGLIQRVEVELRTVRVAVVLTTPACPAGTVILEGLRQAVLGLGDVEACEVFLEWDPPWTPERLSLAARRQLGWEG